MAKKAKKGSCGEPVIVASKVKAYVKGKDMMSSKDFLCQLNCAILELIDKAAARAKENKRSTVQPRDV